MGQLKQSNPRFTGPTENYKERGFWRFSLHTLIKNTAKPLINYEKTALILVSNDQQHTLSNGALIPIPYVQS